MKKIFYILHGFVFSSGTAIIFYVRFADAIVYYPPSDILIPTLFSIILFFILFLIGYLFTRDLGSASLTASLLVLGLLYLWDVFLVIIIVSLISIFLIKLIYREKSFFIVVHLLLNTISVAVVSFYTFQFISLIYDEPWATSPETIQQILGLPDAPPANANTPDIYYIILDGYGRSDVFQSLFNFDNSDFDSAIKERGFIISTGSQANYPRTLFSLSSSLNLQYLDFMSSAMEDSNLWWPVMGAIHKNEVRRILEGWGYKTVFLASELDYTDIRDGDIYVTPYLLNLKNFEIPLLVRTNLSLLSSVGRFGVNFPSYETHRRNILSSFDNLQSVAAIPGPKFVFAHIIALHPPYVFDSMGNPVDPGYPYSFKDILGDTQNQSQNYFNSLMFINKKILTTIDGILANSEKPPVIVIQGDHGTNILFDINSKENSCLYDRFSILNAFYLPGVDRKTLPEDISPVNTFRFIFNKYFHTNLELLPDRNYFSTNDSVYSFTDVTDEIKNTCNINLDGLQ